MSRLGINEVGEVVEGRFDSLIDETRDWRLVDFTQPNHIKVDMQDEAMVVEGVHGVTAIRENLCGGFLLKKFFTEGKIFFSVLEFRKEQTDHPQAEGFTDGVVAACGYSVADVFVDSLSLRGDVKNKLRFSLRCGRWRIGELGESERPCHEAQGNLLSVHPVGTCVGRVVLCPIFDQCPEGFRVFIVACGSVSTDEGVDEGEAVGFPDELDVNMSL